MAELFLARAAGPAGFAKLVAVKRILPELSDDESFTEMFLDEARIAARLNHPNIVHIFDLGESEGSYYIAMEYIEGCSVWSLQAESAKREQLIPVDVSLGIMIAACEGLGFAHAFRNEAGKPLDIIHRDVSPQNLLVSYSGGVKLVDFGIAKAADRVHQTKMGAVKGKRPYMSPEQAMGLPLDQRTDIYALGVILHELLTGRRLFKNQVRSAAHEKELRLNIPPPSEIEESVTPRLDEIAMRALVYRKEGRYASCDEMRHDLEAALAEIGAVNSAARRAQLVSALFLERQDASEDTEPDRAAAVTDREDQPKGGTMKGHVVTTAEEALPPTPIQAATPVTLPMQPLPREEPKPIAVPAPPLHARTTVKARPVAAAYTPETEVPARSRRGLLMVALGGVGAIGLAAFALLGQSSPPPRKIDSPPPPPPPVVVAPKIETAPPPPVAAPVKPATRPLPKLPAPPVEAPPSKPVETPPSKPEHARLSLDVQPPVEVYDGTRALGRTPLESVSLPPGRRLLRLRDRSLGIDTTVEIELAAGRTTDKRVELQKGAIRVKAMPWAEVTLDGRPIGTTPLSSISVFAGTHDLLLTYRPPAGAAQVRRETLLIRDGEDKLVQADFRGN